MKINDTLANYLGQFCFGAAALAFPPAAAGVTAAVGATALVAMFHAERKKHSEAGQLDSEKALKKIVSKVADAWREELPMHGRHAYGKQVSDAQDALIEALPKCRMDYRTLARATAKGGGEFPEKATANVMAQLADIDPATFGGEADTLARRFAADVIRAAFMGAVENENYFRKFEPELLLAMAEKIGDIHDMQHALNALAEKNFKEILDSIVSLRQELPDATAKAVADELERRGHHSHTLAPETIIRLVKKLPNSKDDTLDALINGALTALEAAEAMIEAGAAPTNFDAFVKQVFERTGDLSRQGDFEGASEEIQKAFEQWEQEETARAEASLKNGIALLEHGIQADIAISDAVSAADKETRLVELTVEPDQQFAALRKVQGRYDARSLKRGNRIDAEIAVELARTNLEKVKSDEEQGIALNELGAALQVLGERGVDAALSEAIATFREALEFRPQETAPLDWATTQHNLGIAFATLGDRKDLNGLQRAIEAYNRALEECTPERSETNWATTQNNLGNVYLTLGKRGNDEALQTAIETYNLALTVLTPDGTPDEWARTNNNLGNAYLALSERGYDEALEEAIAFYNLAFKGWSKNAAPLNWATAKNNLGAALAELGKRGDDDALLKAIDAFDEALTEWTQKRVPFDWATATNNRGDVLKTRGERGDASALNESIDAFESAREEWSKLRAPIHSAIATINLGEAIELLGDRTSDRQQWENARNHYLAALEEFSNRAPAYETITRENLARVEAKLDGSGDPAAPSPEDRPDGL